MNKKWEALKNWWEKLGASMDQGDVVLDAQENKLCIEAIITEQKPFQKLKPWQPGCPCIVNYRNGDAICPKYSQTSACGEKGCKYNVYNQRYFKAKEQCDIAKQELEAKTAERVAAWYAFVR